jgi:hypothetical protein
VWPFHPSRPFLRTAADVECFRGAIEYYLDGLAGITPIAFATISEAAATLD